MKKRVAIVGGGLAGIAAAVRLAEHDHAPILIETRKRLGGRATSLEDPRSGLTIDNCQHVLLGCCTNLIDLYERLGVLDSIDWHRTLYWTRGNGIIDVMRAGRLPAPLHLTGSFNRMKLLDKSDRRAIARCMWRMIRMGSTGRLSWRNRTFAEFLEENRQPRDAVDRFWNPIIISACNLDVARVGAAYALQVFQQGFLADKWSYMMGLSTVPLADLYEPALNIIENAGGEVRLGCSARAIAYDGNRVSGVVTADDMVSAAAVISAVPFDRLDGLVSQAMRTADRRLQNLDKLSCSPILGVHLYFEQQVMDLPHLVVIDHGVQWLFNKGSDARGRQHIHAVISAADSWMSLDEDEIVQRVTHDIHAVLPASRGLQPSEARSIKEKRATFAPTPEAEQFRPASSPEFGGGHGEFGSGGGIQNLFLAGDWTDTGWPATMEGAVRSGYSAASGIMGDATRGLIDDIPTNWLASLLGMK